ncbi:MAG: S9 family peptidase [Ignavibacteria bacterium]|nr:S9 family peptidase [Ignavibacteria bacterium]
MKNKNKIKKNDRHQRYPVEKFFSIRTVSGFTVSPDDKTIFFITNTTGSPQIWRVPINGGWPDQVSTWHDAIRGVYHNPKTKELVFMSDKQGDENLQIYKMPEDESDIVYLTAGFEDSQCFFNRFNSKGTKFLFSTNKRLKYNFDVYIQDFKTGKNTLVKSFEDHYPTHAEDWSPNERYMTFVRFYGNINNDILLYDTKKNELVNISEHDIDINVFNAGSEFDKNSKGFYYVSDQDREFKGIRYYDIKKGKSHWVVEENWDIMSFELTHDQKFLIYTLNVNGSITPKMYNLKTCKRQKLNVPKGNYSSLNFTHDDKKLVFHCDSPLTPGEIFVYDLKKGKTVQITNSLVGGVSSKGLTKPKDVFYKSFDGLKIHALLYIPKGLKKDGTNPAILWPHGGPEHQEMHNFSKYVQVFTNAGYIVIAPNFRGSIGYGKTFQKMIYKDWGGAEFKDVLGSVDYLKNSGYVDPKKIAVVGGSFGGFMTLTCITKAPDLWKCAIDIFGPSNLFTFLNSVPEHWKKGTAVLVGDQVEDKDMLHERSPINFVDNIKCPLMVVQGKHDPRVAEDESVQIVNKLKEMNKPVEYILLEDEGHGFSKVSNQIRVFKAKLEFLDKYLRQ